MCIYIYSVYIYSVYIWCIYIIYIYSIYIVYIYVDLQNPHRMYLKNLQFNITFDHFKNWPPKTGLRWDPEIHSARKVLDVCEFRFTSVYPLPSSAFGIGCTMLYLPRPHVVNASTPDWSLNCSLMKLSNSASASLKTEFPDVRGLFDPLLPSA